MHTDSTRSLSKPPQKTCFFVRHLNFRDVYSQKKKIHTARLPHVYLTYGCVVNLPHNRTYGVASLQTMDNFDVFLMCARHFIGRHVWICNNILWVQRSVCLDQITSCARSSGDRVQWTCPLSQVVYASIWIMSTSMKHDMFFRERRTRVRIGVVPTYNPGNSCEESLFPWLHTHIVKDIKLPPLNWWCWNTLLEIFQNFPFSRDPPISLPLLHPLQGQKFHEKLSENLVRDPPSQDCPRSHVLSRVVSRLIRISVFSS